MTAQFNGTSLTDVYFNGSRVESVVFNGTTVHNAKKGAVSYIMSGTGNFDPGEEDINRHFVVVQSEFSSGGLPDRPVPTINGTSMNTVANRTNYFYEDGHSVRISTLKIPTGTGTFTLANCSGLATLYRVVGIRDMSTAYSTNYTEGSGGITMSTVNNGCSFVGYCNNFGYPGSSCSNADSWIVSANRANAADYNTTSSSTAYNPAGYTEFFGLVLGASFAYDYY